MTHLLCKMKVEDYEKWRAVLDSHAQAHRDAGVDFLNVLRDVAAESGVIGSPEVLILHD